MKKSAITILILMTAFSAFAQTRTVTNQDLEKFRQQRLEADRKLKEKYAEMGTTPEEVERQSRERRAELEEYSNQLLVARVMAENERIAQENARREYAQSFGDGPGFVYFSGVSTPYLSYFPFGFKRKSPIRPNLRNLPPNMRIAQEYALGFPNTRSIFSTPRRIAPRRGGWRGGNPSPRPRISIRLGFGGRRGF